MNRFFRYGSGILLSLLVAGGVAYFAQSHTVVQSGPRGNHGPRNQNSDTALVRVLQGGSGPIATGSLTTSKGGAVTTSRASNKTCRTAYTFDVNQLWTNGDPGAGGTSFGVTTLAPDGTAAWRATDAAGTNGNLGSARTMYAGALAASGSTYTLSEHVHYDGSSACVSLLDGSNLQGSVFNIQTGTVVASSGGHTGAIAALANGWFRVSDTGNSSATQNTFYLSDDATCSTSPYNPTVAGATYLSWGAKLEAGSTATPYFPGNNQLLVTLSPNQACVESKGLLAEGTSTNTTQYSQDLGNAAWTKSNVTATSNYGIAPDGTQSATRLQFAALPQSSAFVIINSTNTAPSGVTFTVSGWVRSNTGSNQTFALRSTYSAVADYYGPDLTATNNWQRFSFTQTFATGAGTASTSGICTGSGGAAADLQVSGMQFEALPWASSYIATTSSAAARAADNTFSYGTFALQGSSGSAKTCFVPMQTGLPSATGGGFFLNRAEGGASFLYVNGSDPNVYSYDGVSGTAIGGNFVAGTKRCYTIAWSGSSRTIRNVTDGTSGTSSNAFAFTSATLVTNGPLWGWMTDVCAGPAGACI